MESDKCNRCASPRRDGDRRCGECGVNFARVVRKMRRSRPIGGKRGRNSGTTSKAKTKR